MIERTQKEMIQILFQKVVGIPENPDDNGLIGSVKDINDKLDTVNGRTRKNEVRSKVNQAIIALIISGGGITKLLDIW